MAWISLNLGTQMLMAAQKDQSFLGKGLEQAHEQKLRNDRPQEPGGHI